MKEVYRQCASVVVFRRGANGMEVLLLRKPRKNDAWQLPQGGVEAGESTEVAALRELKEEAGITARLLGNSERIYQYDYPPSYRRFRPDHVKGQQIRFVFAEAEPDVQIAVDGREINDFIWVTEADLTRYIKRKEYREIIRSLMGEGNLLR
ncbi:MAG: NUDIX domain-containing protein [Candidatus Peribacteraceae bacterium]|nr:NUDIX domain-containing protein [Candidatus Peribacteraceae bacterium]MDD5739271.1 NUDIX domain-containing protein [Candidatus Peribacteraceae bacterium]